MVRGWQSYNGLQIWYDWNETMPSEDKFTVPEGCYKGLMHHNVSCRAGPPSPPPPHGIPAAIEKFFCAVINVQVIEDKATDVICNAISSKVGKDVPDCTNVLEF